MKYVTKLNAPDEAYDYFLATLSNRNRIKILNLLLDGPMNVSQLTEALAVDQSTVSNCLSRLKKCGFVGVNPKGKEREYSINHKTIEPLIKLINKHTQVYCTECINRRDNHE